MAGEETEAMKRVESSMVKEKKNVIKPRKVFVLRQRGSYRTKEQERESRQKRLSLGVKLNGTKLRIEKRIKDPDFNSSPSGLNILTHKGDLGANYSYNHGKISAAKHFATDPSFLDWPNINFLLCKFLICKMGFKNLL